MNRFFLFPLILILWINQVALGQSINNLQQGNLVVNILNCRNNKGVVRVVIYDNAEGFPSDPSKGVQFKVSTIRGNIATLTFTGLALGDYAVAVYHDENNNNKMDTNFMGIPSEGYGASNDAKGFMGPPKFADAKFQLNSSSQMINIRLRY